VDGSGELDKDELTLALRMLMGEMPYKVEMQMLEMVDKDGNGEVDLEEFIEGMTTIAMSAPNEDEDHSDESGDSDLDEMDKDIVDLQRQFDMSL